MAYTPDPERRTPPPWGALLALAIASLGLLALASFTIGGALAGLAIAMESTQ